MRAERPSVGLEGSRHLAKHAKNKRKAATQGECPSQEPRVLLAKSCDLHLIDHLIQEMNDKLLSREDGFLGQ